MFDYLTTKTKFKACIYLLFIIFLCLSIHDIFFSFFIFLVSVSILFIKLYFISKTNKENAMFIFKAKKEYEKNKNN